MNSRRVLVYTGQDDTALCAELSKLKGADVVQGSQDRGEFLRQIVEAEGFIGQAAHWGSDIADAMAKAPGLRWLQIVNAGYDNIERAGVPGHVTLTTLGGIGSEVIAEHAVAQLLAVMRAVPLFLAAQQQRRWTFTNLTGSVKALWRTHVAVLGFGPIGRAIRDRLLGFEARVTAVARTARTDKKGTRVVQLEQLKALLGQVDALVVACPSKPETRGLIDAEAFEAMRPGCFVANVSRGSIVDTNALVAALESGKLGGAALDVTDPEPLPAEHPLWAYPNVLITPHTAWAGRGELVRAQVEEFLISNTRRFLAGESLENVVIVDQTQRAVR
ncbi:MAG: D-2-hydroxyacid dehydrogenase [Gammaproteobacteria bacterium]|jgi:phosphoglycerate dehydrogenase-like enzyme